MVSDIVRTWKDARYRQSLISEQQAMLSENPVGTRELADADLEAVLGGASSSGAVLDSLTSKNGIVLGRQLIDSNSLANLPLGGQ